MKSLHKLALIVLLLVAILACTISAPVATPIPATIETATVFTPEKPANKAKMQAGYTSTVTADLLNIRTAPMGAIIPHVWLIEGEQVYVYSCSGIWGRISKDDEPERWVNTYYLFRNCEQ